MIFGGAWGGVYDLRWSTATENRFHELGRITRIYENIADCINDCTLSGTVPGGEFGAFGAVFVALEAAI